MDIFSNCS